MRTVLSIAGSDSSAGAGIQADLKTCSALGVYCMTVITAVTAQNPQGVRSAEYVGDDMLQAQLEAVLESIRPDAVKIGMLPCRSAVEIVAETIRKHRLDKIILDPVLSATSGASLAGNRDSERQATIEAMKELLFPLCTLITPNIPELHILAGDCVDSPDFDITTLPSQWHTKAILIKGGHSDGEKCTDILITESEKKEYVADRIDTRHTHGSGCTLSSAIASCIAAGHEMTLAVAIAKQFTASCIERGTSSSLFHDNGPLIQF